MYASSQPFVDVSSAMSGTSTIFKRHESRHGLKMTLDRPATVPATTKNNNNSVQSTIFQRHQRRHGAPSAAPRSNMETVSLYPQNSLATTVASMSVQSTIYQRNSRRANHFS
mmetsp:Transcript_15122/g.34908  ORF Transcript_15122/g.34908 Transcript_15122/m.34908 type:complete len:112 (+) Transcript_15122:61-396(+)